MNCTSNEFRFPNRPRALKRNVILIPQNILDASVVFVAFTGMSVAWYVAWGHKNYDGPPA